jgi:hypothetical protein
MRIIKLLPLILAIAVVQPAFAQNDKVRVIVMADIGHDPDDEQQIVHLLVCSNEFDLEGLIAVTGRYFRPNPKDTVKTLMPELFDFIIDGYEKVYPNLLLHSEGYKPPQYMRSIVAAGQQGNGMKDVGPGHTSKGSNLIIDAVLNGDPRPLYILSNGGMNTLAQALYDYRSESTKEELQAFISKIRVYDNSGQDESGAWICHEFPDIFYIRGKVQNRSFGGPTNNNLGPHCWKPFEYAPWGQHQWAKEHIQTNHGALGESYPDRKVDGKYHFMGGGGVIPWAGLINPGLSDISHPSWGGWSGRYTAKKTLNPYSGFPIIHPDEKQYLPFKAYTDGDDVIDKWINPADGLTYEDIFTPGWRWRQAIWNDLKARMDWCVEPYQKANHHPIAVLNGDTTNNILTIKANYNETIILDASGSYDPDEDNISYKWWVYPEAGEKPYGMPLEIENSSSVKTSLMIPKNAATKSLHIILEVTDDSQVVPLIDYRRMVVIVTNY